MKEDFKGLDSKLSTLTEIEKPQRDLWPEISDKIVFRRHKSRDMKIPLSMAAGAAIMLMGILLGLRLTDSSLGNESYNRQLSNLEREYRRVKPLSFTAFSTGSVLPSVSLAIITAELDNLDDTTKLLRELLDTHPNDPLIYQKITELYERKFQVLRQINQFSEEEGSI